LNNGKSKGCIVSGVSLRAGLLQGTLRSRPIGPGLSHPSRGWFFAKQLIKTYWLHITALLHKHFAVYRTDC